MIRPVETLNEATLTEEGILERYDLGEPEGVQVRATAVRIARGFRVRVGYGTAELVAKRIVGSDPRLTVDYGLEANEWAPVYGAPEEEVGAGDAGGG